MRKTIGVTVKAALVGVTAVGFIWLGASVVDTVSNNTGDKKVLYVEGQFIEEDPYAEWNIFTIMTSRNQL